METIGIAGIKTDCIFFKGDLPCAPHKKSGVHCPDCPSYQPIETRILIIKLGAIGDVIRTTPLLRKIKKEYPNCKITSVQGRKRSRKLMLPAVGGCIGPR